MGGGEAEVGWIAHGLICTVYGTTIPSCYYPGMGMVLGRRRDRPPTQRHSNSFLLEAPPRIDQACLINICHSALTARLQACNVHERGQSNITATLPLVFCSRNSIGETYVVTSCLAPGSYDPHKTILRSQMGDLTTHSHEPTELISRSSLNT